MRDDEGRLPALFRERLRAELLRGEDVRDPRVGRARRLALRSAVGAVVILGAVVALAQGVPIDGPMTDASGPPIAAHPVDVLCAESASAGPVGERAGVLTRVTATGREELATRAVAACDRLRQDGTLTMEVEFQSSTEDSAGSVARPEGLLVLRACTDGAGATVVVPAVSCVESGLSELPAPSR